MTKKYQSVLRRYHVGIVSVLKEGVQMPEQLVFAMEVFLNGLMAGVLCLGRARICLDIQGIWYLLVRCNGLFSAMTLVGIMEGQVPLAT